MVPVILGPPRASNIMPIFSLQWFTAHLDLPTSSISSSVLLIKIETSFILLYQDLLIQQYKCLELPNWLPLLTALLNFCVSVISIQVCLPGGTSWILLYHNQLWCQNDQHQPFTLSTHLLVLIAKSLPSKFSCIYQEMDLLDGATQGCLHLQYHCQCFSISNPPCVLPWFTFFYHFNQVCLLREELPRSCTIRIHYQPTLSPSNFPSGT